MRRKVLLLAGTVVLILAIGGLSAALSGATHGRSAVTTTTLPASVRKLIAELDTPAAVKSLKHHTDKGLCSGLSGPAFAGCIDVQAGNHEQRMDDYYACLNEVDQEINAAIAAKVPEPWHLPTCRKP